MPTINDLRRVSLFHDLSDEDLADAPLGEDVTLETDGVLFHQGERPDAFYLLLDGHLLLTSTQGIQEYRLTVLTPGTCFGEVPLLAGRIHMATARAMEPCRLVRFDEDIFWNDLMACKRLRRRILGAMAQRMEAIQGVAYQREKLGALGTLASGLAHELNNPSGAAGRAAEQLLEPTFHLARLALDGLRDKLTGEQTAHLWNLHECLLDASGNTALESLDRESELGRWLDSQGIPDAWEKGAILAGCGLGREQFATLQGPALAPALGWLEAVLSIRQLLGLIRGSTHRISDLVEAVKRYAYLDQAPSGEVDIQSGLETTLTIVAHKLSLANVRVERDFEPNLPLLMGQGGLLNQVWTHLLDNAIDAVHGVPNPTIGVETCSCGNAIEVTISDNGCGIPEDIRARIFEPFFTTKPVGAGTGLGLELVWRIVVEQHHGSVRLESEPGRTRFVVSLPRQDRPTLLLDYPAVVAEVPA